MNLRVDRSHRLQYVLKRLKLFFFSKASLLRTKALFIFCYFFLHNIAFNYDIITKYKEDKHDLILLVFIKTYMLPLSINN